MSPPRVPRATYRLQLSREFTFAQATAVVPYLARLGVSHVYCSPYLKARAGSPHGYDIVDHNALNPELGGRDDYEAFVAALAAHDMGQILDVVPNHMGVGGDDNPWWLDVLENGQASDFAEFFDIDWQAAKVELRGKVLLPLLDDHYGAVLERGRLRLAFDAGGGAFSVRYHEHRFPIDPRSYGRLLDAVAAGLEPADPAAAACRGLAGLFEGLPARHELSPERRAQRVQDAARLKERLAQLAVESPAVRALLEAVLAQLNGRVGEPATFDALHALLEEQAYRLAYWRVAADEINYRRFFDVNSLAALRMSRPEVFAATHQLVLELVAAGKIQGLRIDHPDGLYDPAGYCRALQEAIAAHGGAGSAPFYIVAEKILVGDETLPAEWPVAGTTGYEFAALATGLLMCPAGATLLDKLYVHVAGERAAYADLCYERKKLVMRTLMSGELMVLANQLDRLSEAERHMRDYTLPTLRDALMEVIACFPVYRSYVSAQGMSAQDRAVIERAVSEARRRSPAADASVFDFVRRVLLLEIPEDWPGVLREAGLDFVMQFQQYTAPVMAKGMEDTVFYVYNRLVALNDVGGDPQRFAVTPEAFHRANAARREHWPHGLLAGSTHDSKRSEDVRARLAVLSEIPREWRERVLRWVRLNRAQRRIIEERVFPEGNDEYLLYQTLIGVWPLEAVDEAALARLRERIEAYMIKAVREAKARTSWINPNEEYENALRDFIGALLRAGRNRFLDDFVPFAHGVARHGLWNSLTQLLLRLTCPGVPDIYQGNEVWAFQLVDPDNRRPVDHERHAQWLEQLEALGSGSGRAARVQLLGDTLEDGRVKLYVTARALGFRRDQEALFSMGSYEPVEAHGERAEHVCAFLRRHADETVLVAAGRWFARLAAAGASAPCGEATWRDTAIALPPDGPWRTARDVLSGETHELARTGDGVSAAVAGLFSRLPVALLRLR